MKKLIYLFVLSGLIASCTADEQTTATSSNTLEIPSRLWGDYHGAGTNYIAKVEQNKITLETPAIEVKTQGTTTIDNGNTHFEAELINNEKIVILKANGSSNIGITLYRNGQIIVSEYYIKD